MGDMLRFDPITPDGRPSLSVSFVRMLPEDVTVANVSTECIVHPESLVADASADERLEGSPIVQDDDQTVSQFFSGGIADVDYIITWIATYSDGEIEPVDTLLSVRAYKNVGA
ncbi:MAG TPA: hypothetical protein VGN12_08530 [Pirellulales bacterium]|jgi:hypothetical protein